MNQLSENNRFLMNDLQVIAGDAHSMPYFVFCRHAEKYGLRGAEIRRLADRVAARGIELLGRPPYVGDLDSCGVPEPFFNPETDRIIALHGVDALTFDARLDLSVPKAQKMCLADAPQAAWFRDGARSVNHARCLYFCECYAPDCGDIYEAVRDTLHLPHGTLSRLVRKMTHSPSPSLRDRIIRHCMKMVVYLAAAYALRDGVAYLTDYLTCGRAAAVRAAKEWMSADPAKFQMSVRNRIESAIVRWRSKAMRPTRCLLLNAVYGYYARSCALMLTKKTDASGNIYPDCDFTYTDEAAAEKAFGGLDGRARTIMALRLGRSDGICHTCEEVCALCFVTRFEVQQAELAFLEHLPNAAA